MSLRIDLVPLALIHQTWHLVEKFVADGLKHAGDDYTLEQVRLLVSRGEWALVVAVDENNAVHGAMTINIYNAPNHRVAFITSTGGRLIISKDTFNQLCELVKKLGATKISGAGRDSVVRLLAHVGMKKRYTIFEADL